MVVSPANAQLFTLLVGEESEQGVEATTIETLLSFVQSISPVDEIEAIDVFTGGSQALQHAVQGEKLVALDFDGWLYNAQIFKYLMGGLSTGSGPPYTHDFTFENVVDYLTLEAISQDLGTSRKYLGCKVDEVKLSGSMNEPIQLTTSFVGMDALPDATPGSLSVPAIRPFVMVDSMININSIAQTGKLHSFEITSNRNQNPVPSGGQNKRSAVVEGKREHEIIAELVIEDDEILDLLNAGTEFATVFTFIRTASTDQITLTAAKCKIFKQDHPLNIDDEYQRVTVPIKVIGDFIVEAIDANETY